MHAYRLKRAVLNVLIMGVMFSSCSPGNLGRTTPNMPPQATIPPDEQATLIFYNGKILTMGQVLPQAEAIALRDNRILAVGTDDEVLRLQGSETTPVDLSGRTMIPGFVDDHSHIIFSSGSPEDFTRLQNQAISGGITTETE